MSAVTRWFSIDEDGQPQLAGWYEVAYSWQSEDCYFDVLYWDGAVWRRNPRSSAMSYGSEDTAGERWRGLVKKPE